MTITVIARDAEGKKSTWHWWPQEPVAVDVDLVEMARSEVSAQIADETKTPARCVLALIPNPNKQ
jgi:hypothetical protein